MRNLNAVVQRWEVVGLLVGSAVVQLLLANYFVRGLYLDLPLILVLYVACYSSPSRAALTGTVFGLIQDAIYGSSLGLNGLSKTLIGFGGSYLSRVFRLEDALSRSILMLAVSLADGVIVYLMLLILEQPISHGFWFNALVRAAVTGGVGGIGSRLYDRFKFPRKDFRRVSA
jgi:rod shape-determining protein MreD